jgi:hypothetical protein
VPPARPEGQPVPSATRMVRRLRRKRQSNTTVSSCHGGLDLRNADKLSAFNTRLGPWRAPILEKKQHMRWTKSGAQMLLHARCALINGELGKYTGWSPSDSSLEQAVAA